MEPLFEVQGVMTEEVLRKAYRSMLNAPGPV